MNTNDIIARDIVSGIVVRALALGYECLVDDGSGDNSGPFTTLGGVIEELGACDNEYLILRHKKRESGWIKLVHSNGADVVCDYTTNLEHIVRPNDQYQPPRFWVVEATLNHHTSDGLVAPTTVSHPVPGFMILAQTEEEAKEKARKVICPVADDLVYDSIKVHVEVTLLDF